MESSKTARFNLGLVVICFVFTCGVALLAVIGNWPLYKNTQILTSVKENGISELMAIENMSAAAEYAILLIENSAGSGSDIGLIEAEKRKPIILSQLELAGRLSSSPQKADDLASLRSLTVEVFSHGRRWVDAVIQMELGSIAPAFKAFAQTKERYETILLRVRKASRQDLNATLAATIASSKRTIIITILISMLTIPLVIMLQIKLSAENAKLYGDLTRTIIEKSRSLAVIEEQNQALSHAKRRGQETVAKLKEEIAERKKTEEHLRASERRIAQIINFLPDPTFVIDSDSKVIAWNRAIESLTGIKAEEMLGKGDYEYALPFYGERRPVMIDLVTRWNADIARKYRNVKQQGDVLISETEAPPFRIGHAYFLNTAGPLYDEKGQKIGAIETIRDITERRMMEKALREREELLRLYVAYTPAAVAMCDREMRYLAYSRRWISDYRLPAEDLIGRSHYDVFGMVPEKWKQEHRRCLAGEVIVTDEEPLTRSDGSVDWVRREVHPWRTKEGDIGGLLMFTEVLTSKKQMELASQEQASRLQTIGENLPGGMIYQVLLSPDGTRRFTYVSGGVRQLHGYTPDQVLADPMLLYNRIVVEDRARIRAAEDEALRGLHVFDIVARFRSEDGGGVRWHRLVSQPRRLEGGGVVFDGIDLDITELKTAEEESRQRQKFIESVLYHAPDAIIILDADHKVLEWNPGAVRMFGYTPEEARGIDLDQLVAPAQAHSEATSNTRLVMSGQRLEALETVRYRKDGTPLNVIAAGSPIKAGQTLKAIVAMYTDITALKKNEAEIRQSRDMLELVINTIPQFIYWKDVNSVYLGCNQNFARVAGVGSPAAVVGKTDYDLAWKKLEADSYRASDVRVMQSKRPEYHIIKTQQQADGKQIFLDSNKVPIHDSQSNVIGVLGSYEDITERLQADEELKRLRNLLSNIIDSMPSVLVGVDIEGCVTEWNKLAEQVTGLTAEAAKTRPLKAVFPRLADEVGRIREAIENRRVLSEPKKAYRHKGETHFEDITIYPLIANGIEGAVVLVDDVTERVRLEEMMIQSEKMLSVGGLAAGMAHEINNPLAGILQTAQVVSQRLRDKIPANLKAAEKCGLTMEALQCFMEARGIPDMLETIEASGRRAAEIVANMLSFARKSDASVSTHDLGLLLDRTVELAAADYDLKKKHDFKQIEIVREYPADGVQAPCESSKIQQVFLNILKNGAEAMAERPSGGRPPRFILRVGREGRWAWVEIEDNGPGMDEVCCRRVFEPFFTTKPAGQGTGLGMSVSYFIVTENHGGEMTVSSIPGQGSRFLIRLPLDRGSKQPPLDNNHRQDNHAGR